MKQLIVAVFHNPKTKETKKYATGDFSHTVPAGFLFERYETTEVSDSLYKWLYSEVTK